MSADAFTPGRPDPSLVGSVAHDLDHIFRAAPPAAAVPAAPKARILGGRSLPRKAARASLASLGALIAAGLVGLSIGAVITRPPGPPTPPTTQAPAPAPVQTAPVIVAQAPVPAPEPAPAKAEPAPPAKAAPPRRARSGGRSYADMLAADRRLRRAYERAIRAGVPRATLASYRSRWASLRRRSSDEPARLIAGYASLASDLNRLADRRRSRA